MRYLVLALCCLINPMVAQAKLDAPPAAKRFPKITYAVLTAALVSATVADIQLSRGCMDRFPDNCREANVMLPHSLVGTYAVEAGVDGAMATFSANLFRSGHGRCGRVGLAVLTTAHVAGAILAARATARLARH